MMLAQVRCEPSWFIPQAKDSVSVLLTSDTEDCNQSCVGSPVFATVPHFCLNCCQSRLFRWNSALSARKSPLCPWAEEALFSSVCFRIVRFVNGRPGLFRGGCAPGMLPVRSGLIRLHRRGFPGHLAPAVGLPAFEGPDLSAPARWTGRG